MELEGIIETINCDRLFTGTYEGDYFYQLPIEKIFDDCPTLGQEDFTLTFKKSIQTAAEAEKYHLTTI